MRTANPALNNNTFASVDVGSAQPMTLQGTVNKTAVMLGLLLVAAVFTWQKTLANSGAAGLWIAGGAITGLILSMVTIFKREWAPVTAPLYALAEGLFLGAVSAMYQANFNGIVLQAVLLTIGVALALLAAYSMRIVKVTENFKLGVIAATGGIFLVYMINMVLGLFGIHIPGIFGAGALGIGFCLFVVIIAALNLVLDFDFIENGCTRGAPKFMEWYAAFGLLVTLVWLYLEILRLLALIASSQRK